MLIMFLYLLLLLTGTYMIFSAYQKNNFADPKLRILMKKTHKYSGLDPGNYRIFVDNMLKVERELDEKLLYSSLDIFRSMSHNISAGDTDIYEEIDDLVFAIGQYAEAIIFNKRIKDGVSFIPNYLNQNVS